uniref:proline-rich protein 18 n=1 Tax=Myodes glareolus TaxID=447135 RepID=UPI00202241D2|nr:proline-rich protein 18 [Myodes glareolus]
MGERESLGHRYSAVGGGGDNSPAQPSPRLGKPMLARAPPPAARPSPARLGAILVIQRRHLEKQLMARSRRPFPTPSVDPRRPLVPCPRTRTSTLRRGGPTSVPDAPLAVAVSSRSPSASLMPGGLQATMPSSRPSSLRPVLKVSLLNEKHKYDDEEYEEEVEVVDEGLVRKCTEWLRGVESAAAARGRTGHLDSLPHLSTL